MLVCWKINFAYQHDIFHIASKYLEWYGETLFILSVTSTSKHFMSTLTQQRYFDYLCCNLMFFCHKQKFRETDTKKKLPKKIEYKQNRKSIQYASGLTKWGQWYLRGISEENLDVYMSLKLWKGRKKIYLGSCFNLVIIVDGKPNPVNLMLEEPCCSGAT